VELQATDSGTATPAGQAEPSEIDLFESEDEVQLGSDDQTSAANNALRALSRASRSYLIYDSQNQAIRGFLQAVSDAFSAYQERFGDMRLEVRPFELMLDGQTVYVEREREGSLAFKLFRDGVRRLNIGRQADWDELTRLLEVISVRYVGIHQNPADDDMVTLLWKAGFQNIKFEAVEGFIPDDDEVLEGPQAGVAELQQVHKAGELAGQRVPRDFDLPAPELPEPVPPSFQDIELEDRIRIIGEDTSATLPETTVNLIRELLAPAADPTDPLNFSEMTSLLREIRGFLLAEDQLEKLLTLFRMVTDYRNTMETDQEAVDRVLAGFVDERALSKLIRSVPRDAHEPPKAFFELLDQMTSDPIPALLDILERERGAHERRICRTLIQYFLPERSEDVLERLQGASGAIATDLLHLLAKGAPEAAHQALTGVVRSGDSELQLAFLKLARDVDMGPQIRSVLVMLLHSPEEEVRMRTLRFIVDQGEEAAFPVIRAEANKRLSKASEREVCGIGETLAQLNGTRAMKLFNEWMSIEGFWQRLFWGRSFLVRHVPRLAESLRRFVPSPYSQPVIMAVTSGLIHIDQVAAREMLADITSHPDVRIAKVAREVVRGQHKAKLGAGKGPEEGVEEGKVVEAKDSPSDSRGDRES